MNLPEGFVIDDEISPPPGFKLDETADTSKLESLGRGLAQGGSFGFADELSAGVQAPFSDKTYTDIRDENRLQDKAAQESNPKTFLSGQVGGGVASALIPFGGQLGKAAQIGRLAVEGGIAGLGTSEADLTKGEVGGAAIDTLKGAGMGAGAGVALGAAGKVLGKALGKGGTKVAEESVPTGSTFQETVSNLGKGVPQSVKDHLAQAQDFVGQKYGQMAQKPGFKDIIGDAMIRRAQGMRYRELGGTPAQARILARDLGEDGLRELVDVAKHKGITRSPVGFVRRQATKELMESAGKGIGSIREMAAKRGAVHDADSLIEKIKSKLDSEYLGEGTASLEKGSYLKALEDVRTHAKTPDALAKKITDMNRRAVANKMTQPKGAITDVVNEASRLNNELVKKHLSPKEVEFYEDSLRDFAASKLFGKLQGYELGREMGGRSGPGGILRNIKQSAMDMGGSKVMENFYDKFGPRLKSTPGLTKNLSSLGEGAIDDLMSALDEALDEVVKR